MVAPTRDQLSRCHFGVARGVVDARIDQRQFYRLGILGLEFETDVAVGSRPAGSGASDKYRAPSREALHPLQSDLPLLPQQRRLGVGAEQTVVITQRLFDLLVAG